MRVDTSDSRYCARADAEQDFDRAELQKCKTLLRRLQFLEVKVNENGGITGVGGAVHAEYEMLSLEWILTEVGFLDDQEVSGNTRQREGTG